MVPSIDQVERHVATLKDNRTAALLLGLDAAQVDRALRAYGIPEPLLAAHGNDRVVLAVQHFHSTLPLAWYDCNRANDLFMRLDALRLARSADPLRVALTAALSVLLCDHTLTALPDSTWFEQACVAHAPLPAWLPDAHPAELRDPETHALLPSALVHSPTERTIESLAVSAENVDCLQRRHGDCIARIGAQLARIGHARDGGVRRSEHA